jgi:hypothetical protein
MPGGVVQLGGNVALSLEREGWQPESRCTSGMLPMEYRATNIAIFRHGDQ